MAGVEGEAELPYATLHRMLQPALDAIDDLPEQQASALKGAFGMGRATAADQFLVGVATLTLLSGLAAERPLLCLIDDGQWGDAGSAEALYLVARRIAYDPVGLVVASRQKTGPSGDLPISVDPPTLRLDGLAPEAAAALLAREAPALRGHLRDRVLESAAGNPLALMELPKTVSEENDLDAGPLPITDRLQRVFHGRVGRLGKAARTLLVLAAAEGTGDLATVMRAADVLALPVAALAEAERAGLVIVTVGSVRFRHPLVRAAVYQAALFTERQVAHRALAEILRGSHPDRWARHLAAATLVPDEKVAAALERVADSVARRDGHAAAARVYERSAQLSEENAARARRLAAAATAALEAGRFRQAEELCATAARLTDEPAVVARLAGARGRLAFERGSPLTAARISIDGAAQISDSEPLEAAKLLVAAAYWAGHGADTRLVGEAVTLLDTLALQPDHEFQPYMRHVRGYYRILLGEGADEALFSAPRPIEVWEQTWTARMLNVAGKAEEALEVASAMVASTRDAGLIGHLANALFHQACAQTLLGRHRAAADTAEEALALALDTRQTSVAAYLRGSLAWLAALDGDDERCRALAGEAIRHADDSGTPPSAAEATWALALLDLGHGRYEAALSRMANRFPFWPCSSAWVRSTADHLEAAIRAGEPGIAARRMEELDRYAGRILDPWAPATLARCRALLSPAGQTEPYFAAALRDGSALHRPFEQARTLLAYGEWLRREHRRADARVRLRAALEIFQRLGARLWAVRAREELRATGDNSSGAAPASGPAAKLTAQELRVARLAATGATNREIAAQLFLSPRTVAQHLHRAYPKLDITTRTQLASLDLDA
ncbi:LuxR C-terminal-related transcriptional regulator [Microbispora corallina]|uniref:LuxR C-terminal-related transcriptional regulator n=1 Tax=Microbispora corallina TaxID=83302 RepID=UPI001EF186D3|nr:LuxR family transcriptional regulator [Microbispora corallina]